MAFFCSIALNKAKSHCINRDVIQIRRPATLAAIWVGSAQRISFFTPEREVYVEQPVKFMARNPATAGIINSQARDSVLPAQVCKLMPHM